MVMVENLVMFHVSKVLFKVKQLLVLNSLFAEVVYILVRDD